MSRTKRTIIIFAAAVVLVGALIAAARLLVRISMQGETRPEFDRAVSRTLLDSARTGLVRFYAANGHYPHSSGKYFVDSIAPFVRFDHAYLYMDSTAEDGRIVPKNLAFRGTRIVRNMYLGAGTAALTIIYRPLSDSTYLLYSVGLNLTDENGDGDDIQ